MAGNVVVISNGVKRGSDIEWRERGSDIEWRETW